MEARAARLSARHTRANRKGLQDEIAVEAAFFVDYSLGPSNAEEQRSAPDAAAGESLVSASRVSEHGLRRGPLSLFAVFDGHGGRAAAAFAKARLFGYVRRELAAGREAADALSAAFLETDAAFLQRCPLLPLVLYRM